MRVPFNPLPATLWIQPPSLWRFCLAFEHKFYILKKRMNILMSITIPEQMRKKSGWASGKETAPSHG
jgi:hypothetical protein